MRGLTKVTAATSSLFICSVQRLNVKGQDVKLAELNVICSETGRPANVYTLVATRKPVLVTPDGGFFTFVTTILMVPEKTLLPDGTMVAVRELLPELGGRAVPLLYLN